MIYLIRKIIRLTVENPLFFQQKVINNINSSKKLLITLNLQKYWITLIKKVITIKNINVRITETQEQKIKQSGLNTSEYVRKCIDFYDLRRENAYRYSRLSAIEECIESLKTIKKEESEKIVTETPLYKIDENVKKNDEKKLCKNDENVKNLDNARRDFKEQYLDLIMIGIFPIG